MNRRLLSLVLFGAVFVGAGCGGGAPAPASPASQAPPQVAPAAPPGDVSQVGAGEDEDESTADLAEHHRYHHHGGFAMFIAMSLDTLGVSPDQRDAISRIQTDMHAKMQPAHDAEKAVLVALADGVAAGHVDRARIDSAIAQLASASSAVHDAVADSINALHGILTPEQRQALVDKVEASYEVWHDVNSPDESAARDSHGGHVRKLADDLGLSPDQVEKIRSTYASAVASAPKYDRAEADAHFKAFAAAFTSDSFDAHAPSNGASVNAHMAVWGLTRIARLYEAAAPVLTPEQRTKAADALRHHANYKRTDSET